MRRKCVCFDGFSWLCHLAIFWMYSNYFERQVEGFSLSGCSPAGGAWGTVQMVVFACGPFLETIAPYESSNRKSEDKELDNIYWSPGTGNPADGMTRMKSEMSPMLNLLEFGEFHPGVLRPLLGVGSSEPTGWLGGHSALINFGQLPNACIMSFFFSPLLQWPVLHAAPYKLHLFIR